MKSLNTQSNYTSNRQKQLRSAVSQENLRATVLKGGMMNTLQVTNVDDEGERNLETNSIRPFIMMNKRGSVPTVNENSLYKSPPVLLHMTLDTHGMRTRLAESFETEPQQLRHELPKHQRILKFDDDSRPVSILNEHNWVRGGYEGPKGKHMKIPSNVGSMLKMKLEDI